MQSAIDRKDWMSKPETGSSSVAGRHAIETIATIDDCVLPFATNHTGVSGRLVRLGPTLDKILTGHDYPDSVSVALGEALVLATLLGSALKIAGQLILQTKSDGPLGMLIANYDAPGRLRGYAGFDRDRVAATLSRREQAGLLGRGHLAMTIDPGGDLDRYQGIVALDGVSLVDAAHTYFRQSEQLPTLIRVAVARQFVDGAWHWRAGGLMIQQVARGGGIATAASFANEEERDLSLDGEHDDGWNRNRILAGTVEDHELLDPTLDPHRLIYRLFHEEGVTARPVVPMVARCRCSRERLLGYLRGFGADELADLREPDGTLAVKCEFCSTEYRYGPDDGAT